MSPPGAGSKKAGSGGRDAYHHLLLLAADEAGYRNLVRLATAAHLEGYYYKPRIDKELLEAHHDGLIALSGCLASEIPELILREQPERARATIDWFKQIFGPDRFYLELQNHQLPEQAKVNAQLRPCWGTGVRSEIGSHQRRALRQARAFARPRLPDLHRDPEPVGRRKAPALRPGTVLPPLGRGDAGAVPRGARGGPEHPRSGRAMQRRDRVRQAALPRVRAARSISPAKDTSATCWPAALPKRYGIRARAEGERVRGRGT